MALATDSKADPKAVEVARAVYDAIPLESVILFGSRARGDHRPDSDIDLMLIYAERISKEDYRRASIAAHAAADRIYDTRMLSVDLVLMPKSRYMRCRGGINHVTAQAARDGFNMNGDKQEYERATQPFDWGDIRQRVINTDRELITFEKLLETAAPQEAIGFHAQQALENILKGWISAVGAEYGNTHRLDELMGIIRNIPKEQDTPAGEDLRWLTHYAVEYRYEGAVLKLDDPLDLYHYIDRVVDAIYERIKTLTGVEELPRYTPPEQRLTDD